MKTLTTALLIVLTSVVLSQTINDVPMDSIDSEHLLIMGTKKFLSTKVMVTLDFGQETKLMSTKKQIVKDENGKAMTFNSMIDALNFFTKYGYEFVNAYAVTVGNSNVYHWLLRKL